MINYNKFLTLFVTLILLSTGVTIWHHMIDDTNSTLVNYWSIDTMKDNKVDSIGTWCNNNSSTSRHTESIDNYGNTSNPMTTFSDSMKHYISTHSQLYLSSVEKTNARRLGMLAESNYTYFNDSLLYMKNHIYLDECTTLPSFDVIQLTLGINAFILQRMYNTFIDKGWDEGLMREEVTDIADAVFRNYSAGLLIKLNNRATWILNAVFSLIFEESYIFEQDLTNSESIMIYLDITHLVVLDSWLSSFELIDMVQPNRPFYENPTILTPLVLIIILYGAYRAYKKLDKSIVSEIRCPRCKVMTPQESFCEQCGVALK